MSCNGGIRCDFWQYYMYFKRPPEIFAFVAWRDRIASGYLLPSVSHKQCLPHQNSQCSLLTDCTIDEMCLYLWDLKALSSPCKHIVLCPIMLSSVFQNIWYHSEWPPQISLTNFKWHRFVIRISWHQVKPRQVWITLGPYSPSSSGPFHSTGSLPSFDHLFIPEVIPPAKNTRKLVDIHPLRSAARLHTKSPAWCSQNTRNEGKVASKVDLYYEKEEKHQSFVGKWREQTGVFRMRRWSFDEGDSLGGHYSSPSSDLRVMYTYLYQKTVKSSLY